MRRTGAVNDIAVTGSPPPWSVTSLDGFLMSAFSRARRAGQELPDEFFVSFCPWGERNAAVHALSAVADVFEPRYRLVHFTSCGRPFLIAIMTGNDARERQQKVMRHLPWSEHYSASLDGDHLTLTFIGDVQDADGALDEVLGERSLKQLFESGELKDL